MPKDPDHDPLLPGQIVPVLAGGGTRLPAHVGVMAALADLGLRHRHLVGVSGGSVVASLTAAGHDVHHMKELFLAVDFNQFRGMSLANLLLHGGLSTGRRFLRWLDGELQGRRFRDLDVDLHVVATDVRAGKPVIFDRSTSPDLEVAQAVMYSISIPLVFPFHHHGDYILVDGSILAEDSLFRDWAGDGTPVMCFRMRDEQGTASHPSRRLLPVADYLFMLMRTFMTTLSREHLSDTLWHNTVVIRTDGLSPLEFHMTAEQKTRLYQAGYDTTRLYLPRKLGACRSVPPDADP
ncbi:MAG TPA: patatin-like phospholipase family protein [Thiobacillaceae bacterium]|nr:patatin-like phospholipase family protein [Thiobacillaceae bacterium]HNU63967.1 patatin-like phospholipase family protein [Thiobacillaceae bacterium]